MIGESPLKCHYQNTIISKKVNRDMIFISSSKYEYPLCGGS